MPTPTTRLGLLKPSTADPFVTADLASNWQKIDDTPGYYVCTSTTRPAWGAAQQGMLISEKDTGLIWQWDGAAFQRIHTKGLLKTTTGAWARGQRTSDFTTTNYTTPQVVTSISNVVVPDGRRTLMIFVSFKWGINTNGHFYGYIYRSNVSGQSPQLAAMLISGNNFDSGQGTTFITYEAGGLPAGTYNWSFQVMCGSIEKGTSTIKADSGSPCEISVIEI